MLQLQSIPDPRVEYRSTTTSNQTSRPTPRFLNKNSSNVRLNNNIYITNNNQLQQQRDVTDNKTDLITTMLNNSRNNRNVVIEETLLNNEQERLKTFDHINWQITFLEPSVLAKIGMYYTGHSDKVKCYFCTVVITRWEENDNPLSEHIRWSPNCPLLKRRTTTNIPIDFDSLDRILPPASFDICGANDIIEVRPAAYAEGTISSPNSQQLNNSPILLLNHYNTSNNMNSNNSSNNSSPQAMNNTTHFQYPDHPEFNIESARIRSYIDRWPKTMKQKPEQLSEAGFFYTGIGDRVKCFSCGGGLKDWDNSDDPWEQHALWLSNCRFLKLIKGSSFIDQVKNKYQNATNKTNDECQQTTEQQTASKELLSTTSTEQSASNADINQDQTNPELNSLARTTATTATSGKQQQNAVNHNNNNNKCCSNNISNIDEFRKSNINTTISEEKLCKICYAGEYNTAFLPCGHVVACAKCASSVTKCPMCRKPFTDVMRVYFS